MTAVLPAITVSIFEKHWESVPCRREINPVLLSQPRKPINLSTDLVSTRPQQQPLVSRKPIPFRPSEQHDENTSPSAHPESGKRLQLQSTDRLNADTRESKRDAVTRPTVAPLRHKPKIPSLSESRLRAQPQTTNRWSSSPLRGFRNDTPTPAKSHGLASVAKNSRLQVVSDMSAGASSESLEPFPVWTETSPRVGDDGDHLNVSASLDHAFSAGTCTSRTNPRFAAIEQCHRPSDASSGCIHTIRTASMSNISLSIMPQSLRFVRSCGSQGLFGEHLRRSLDSERPTTNSSLDDLALSRGLKRRHIINELIMTEESYVADLKALAYLYSTLLASTTTLSGSLRMAIQRNVTSLVHTHENLLSKLHQANLRAAARKWADARVSAHPAKSPRARLRRSGLQSRRNLAASHRRARSSVDSAEMLKASNTLGTAEPADILDVTAAFSCVIEELSVYEEYCANHQIIAQELQRHLPSLWSTYESGMESLNRALVALSRRRQQDRKGLTVGDLLIKPIQRICKYPLLLDDLMKQTPVVDGPSAYQSLELLSHQFRTIVQAVNIATDNNFTRDQIQKKWHLQDRFDLDKAGLSRDAFRTFGSIQLCGVLYLAFQTADAKVQGNYGACVLFDNHLLLSLPSTKSAKLDVCAVIALSDLSIESATNSKGLQSPSALHTWKVCFAAEDRFYEILLSACSKAEEDQWVRGLRGAFRPAHFLQVFTHSDESKIFKDLKSTGNAFRPHLPLSRQPSVQRAATVGRRTSICQVILRNTHNPQDLQEYRSASSPAVSRSQSHNAAGKIVVLAPKKSERTRLETSLSDVYTKDRLPFPGMIGSRGGQIIRASAGSLVRKLSFASMHTPFSRRSTSLSSKKSCDTVRNARKDLPALTVCKQNLEDPTSGRQNKPKDLPELDTMDSLIGRMIHGGAPLQGHVLHSNGKKTTKKSAQSSRSRRTSICFGAGPEDPAVLFNQDKEKFEAMQSNLSDTADKDEDGVMPKGPRLNKRKRWSNPIAKLRGLGSDGFRNMLNHSGQTPIRNQA